MTAQAGGASSLSLNADSLRQRAELRRIVRGRRAALPAAAGREAARRIARYVLQGGLLRPGMHVAVYLRSRSEADLSPLIDRARRLGCHLYLPRIVNVNAGRMEFRRFARRAALIPNRFGILEPDRRARRITPRALDRVFVPLVAFDAQGHRLGSGAGFYDRRFAFLRAGHGWRRPRLIGIGYELQKVPELDVGVRDVPLDAIVTEYGVYRPRAPVLSLPQHS